jgi:murein DD-endopeptidase MepM/ murein hydrolase activator NlpD
MKDYNLMLVGDERSPVRRFHIPGQLIQRALYGAGVLALIFVVGMWDYWRLRADNAELAELRVTAAEQREQIEIFKSTLDTVEGDISRVRELERKVRIIANLPGAAAAGGEGVVELAPEPVGGTAGEAPTQLPIGVPITPQADALPEGGESGKGGLEVPMEGLTTGGAQLLDQMDRHARSLGDAASTRVDSLDELVAQLEEKRTRLASMPSIWPAKGWLTSRYGYRISPFTGRRHLHAGIDIAARPGTMVIAPARGRVRFVGSKGPLGKAVILDHGYGVRTVYGHNSELHVKVGDEVVRGQQIASVGSTGRSTGPHLHYVVEVRGKSKDPLNYIFD